MEKRSEQEPSPDEPWREVPEADDRRDPRLVPYIDDSAGSQEEGDWRGASVGQASDLWAEKYLYIDDDDPGLREAWAVGRVADLMVDATPAQRAILAELLSVLADPDQSTHGAFAEVARRLGISASTVRVQMSRLRARAQE